MFLKGCYKKNIWLCLAFFLIALLSYSPFCSCVFKRILYFYNFIIDRTRVETFILSYGWFGPFVFMILQILQVVFAPIPGEATGFIGGYVFGVTLGFLYSSFSLAIGSWIIFWIGRFFGRKYIRLIIPKSKLSKFNYLLNERGFITLFLCFIFPGFPKDYLCMFLGMTNIPIKKFLFLTSVGRMPGTFFLSLQGSAVFEGAYCFFFIYTAIMLLITCISLKYKDRIHNLFAKLD